MIGVKARSGQKKSLNRMGRIKSLFRKLLSSIVFTLQVLRYGNKKDKVFFMILMPGSLHVSLLAMNSFPNHKKLIVISNGLNRDENVYLKELGTHTVFTSYIVLRHHIILNILFRYWRYNFGIVDNDCFVRNPKVIDDLTGIKDSELLASKYYIDSKRTKTAYKIPETFLMYFNIKKIRYIRKKYRVSARIYSFQSLPKKVRIIFKNYDIQYPESGKYYFDTLRVIFILGCLEHLSYSSVSSYDNVHGDIDEVYHIGAMSKPQNFNSTYGFRGTYFWIRAIESSNDLALEKIARRKFDYPNSSALIHGREIEQDLPPGFQVAVNKILS